MSKSFQEFLINFIKPTSSVWDTLIMPCVVCATGGGCGY